MGYFEGAGRDVVVVGSGVGMFSCPTITSPLGVVVGVRVGVGDVPEKKAGRDIFTWGNIF